MVGKTLSGGIISWGTYKDAPEVNASNLLFLIDHLRSISKIPADISLFNVKKIEAVMKKAFCGKRQFKLANLTSVTFIAAGVLAAIFAPKYHTSTKASFSLIAFAVGFASLGIGANFWKKSLINLQQQLDFSEYLSDELTPEQKNAVVSEMNSLREQREQLYFISQYNTAKKVTDFAWVAENWFLLLAEETKWFKGVWLDGTSPPKKICIQNPKVAKDNDENNKPELKKRSRNNRSKIHLQDDALANNQNIRKLIKLIYAILPEGYTHESNALNRSRKARLKAIEYIKSKDKFWKRLRSDIIKKPANKKNIIHSNKYSTHRIALTKIFSDASKNQSTLGQPGEKMMLDFVSLKDRTLESWLEELNWEIGK